MTDNDEEEVSLAVDDDVDEEDGFDRRKSISPDVRSYSASLYVGCTVSNSALNRTDFFMM